MPLPTLLAGIFQALPDAFESVWNFFYAGKVFMLFLLALSALSVSVIIYKALDLRRRLVLPDAAVGAIESAPHVLDERSAHSLAGELRGSRSALGRLGLVALDGGHDGKEDASRAVEARAREEVVELETGVALLEVVITIAPLLGLLGTVSGLVNVFSNLGDTADHGAIAMGIAEALNTTIAGLAIAVPTVVAHSYFMKKIERMGVRMEILLGGLLASIYREPAAAEALGEISPAAEPEVVPASEPQVYAAIPDPGADVYADAVPEEVTPATDPAFPRLLAGQQAVIPEEIAYEQPTEVDNGEGEQPI